MFLFYFDEVKYDPPRQNSFWIGGISVDVADALEIEKAANNVAEAVFGDGLLEYRKEFHGIELVQGKGCFKGVDIENRAAILRQLLEIISDERVVRYYIKINPENIVATSDPPDEIAFMFLVERINEFLSEKASLGLILQSGLTTSR